MSKTPEHLRFYRLLLRLFPRRFRARRASEMERLFLDMCRERRRRGRGLGPGFWLPLIWDTLSHAIRERVSGRRSPGESGGRAPVLDGIRGDLRFAVRSLAGRPFHAVTILLMIAVAIGGNAAVFRVFNGLFLRPLPFEASERLVDLDVRAPRWNLEYVGMAYADFAVWREKNRTFEAMGVFDTGAANLVGDDGATRIGAVAASHDLPDVLGLEPVLGRFFLSEEDVPGGPRLVVLAHDFWRSRYGGARDVIGRSAVLDGEAYEIVGVLPPEASFVAEAEVWTPLQDDPGSHSSFYLQGIGRLRPGVTAERARDDLTSVHKGMVERFPVNRGTFPRVESVRSRFLGEYELGVGVLMGAVAIVLLIACANIAGLMLARSLDRSREVGIRLAMGASRLRIVRPFLAESLLLAGGGAVVGAWLGFRGSSLFVDRLARAFPPWVGFDLDWRFVAFTAAVTVATAVLSGLVPAIHSSRVDPVDTLQSSSTRTTASTGRRRLMAFVVTGEVALAVLLLVVGGLTARDLHRLRSVDPGVRTEAVLSYRLALPETRYASDPEILAFWDRHLERVRALPGVTGAAATTVLPLSGQHSGYFFSVEGVPPPGEGETNPVVLARFVTPGYLETMGVELVSGRPMDGFDGREEEGGGAVVNETFVREFLGHRSDPLGARIQFAGSDEGDPWWTVVGVTRDTKHYGVDEEMRPGVYLPLRHVPSASMNLVVRTDGDPNRLVPSVRRVIREHDPQLALFEVATMKELLEDSLWARRASAWLIGAFSAVALLLAVGGLYGLISYTVSQKTREIGIRIALGADAGRVVGRVLRDGMLLVVFGVVLGLVAAVGASGVVSNLLVGVSATDPWVYAGVAVLLLAVAAVANVVPARRAARLEPMGVLREE